MSSQQTFATANPPAAPAGETTRGTPGSVTLEELSTRLAELERSVMAERLRHAVLETFLVDENHQLRRTVADLLQRWEPETWAEVQRKAKEAGDGDA